MELFMLLISLYYLYHLLFLLFSLGLSRPLTGTPAGTGQNRLAVFMPAHNEENVIASSVRSILASRYPGNKFDVYVIADNCTDRTAELARAAGALVLERENKTLRGKQHALKWAFEQINLDEYDAVVILDADNHVHPGFLGVLDHYLAAGHKVIQGYVETKNPGDSWVTANYAYMFWYLCRLQMARTRLGLSAWLAGTGLCISTDVLRRVGWNVTTLVDDVEYTCQLLLSVPVFYLLPLLAERVRIRRAWTYLLTAGAFFFTWIPITAYGVVTCDQKSWWRTRH